MRDPATMTPVLRGRSTGRSTGIDTRRIAAFAVAGVALATAAGLGGWAAGRSRGDRIPALERRVRSLESAVAAASSERDRLKADRDRLEARLAALDATPAACPEETLSTSGAQLAARFVVEYPCGWNVLEEPLQRPEAGSPRAGLVVDHLFFSALPITKAPRQGPLTEITLDTWYDDPEVEGDALPTLDAWLAEAKRRFTAVQQTEVRTRSGIRVFKLTGSMTAFDQPRPALLYVWELNVDGVRTIAEAFSLDPARSVTTVIDSLVRSFRLLGG